MRRLPFVAVVVVLLTSSGPVVADQGAQCKYIGGTLTVAEKTSGSFDLSKESEAIFRYKGGEALVTYSRIESIEYGQKAGRRVGVAIVISVWALFSKKRKHFLTLGYKDADDVQQGVVIELPKGTPKSIITVIEARSGVKCEYESEEARKHVHG